MPEYHSPLGGSSAQRFLNCPGSISLGADSDNESSVHANTGTVAHTLAAACLRGGADAWQYVGGGAVDENYPDIFVDKEMADAVQVYLDYIREERSAKFIKGGGTWANVPAHEYIEEFFHLPELHEHFAGTADYALVRRDDLLIVDYKNGVGIVVEAQDNPQLMYYAAGTIEKLGLWEKLETVKMVIVQPRAPHAFGPVRSWEIKVSELYNWLCDTLIPGMYEAEWSTATSAGKWCQFCPCLVRQCPAVAAVVDELEELMKMKAADMTPEQMSRVLVLGEVFKKHNSAVIKAALARAEKGVEIPGFKIVKGYGHRVWKSGAPVEEEFGEDAFEAPKLKGPAGIQKLPLGKKFATRWGHPPETGNKLVPDVDARQAQGPSQKSMFQSVTGDTTNG